MINRSQREHELYISGMVDGIKKLFANSNAKISEEYYVLMADYIDSLDMIKDSMQINPAEIARRLPNLVQGISEQNLGGLKGITKNKNIVMNKNLSYEQKKLYFFHELTHALQSRDENSVELCGFENGKNGMFLTEGLTQYTAEILYHISNDTPMPYNEQTNTVRGAENRVTYGPLSTYQYNGNVAQLLRMATGLSMPELLSLAYQPNGRNVLKQKYENLEGTQAGEFEDFMDELEQIYAIDKILLAGKPEHKQLLYGAPIPIEMNGTTFLGNIETYKKLMDKVERDLAAKFILSNNLETIMQKKDEFAQYLTTPQLKEFFLDGVRGLTQDLDTQGLNTQSLNTQGLYTQENIQGQTRVQENNDNLRNHGNIANFKQNRQEKNSDILTQTSVKGYFINQYGEIINLNINSDRVYERSQNTIQNTAPKKLSFLQRVAQFMQKNDILMNFSAIDGFVRNQLNTPPKQQKNNSNLAIERMNQSRAKFDDWITGDGTLQNLPQPKALMSQKKLDFIKQRRTDEYSDDVFDR